jgi:hypothetical protein
MHRLAEGLIATEAVLIVIEKEVEAAVGPSTA